jgi:hypothetical protein
MDVPARNINDLIWSLLDSLTIDHGAVPASPESKNPSAASPQSGSADRGRVDEHYSTTSTRRSRLGLGIQTLGDPIHHAKPDQQQRAQGDEAAGQPQAGVVVAAGLGEHAGQRRGGDLRVL